MTAAHPNNSPSLNNLHTRVSDDKTYAAASYDKAGKSIGIGSHVKRLEFGQGADKIKIAVKGTAWTGTTPKLGFLDKKLFVVLKLGNQQKVHVNVNSLASRLGLSKKEIREAATRNDGSLENLIDHHLKHQMQILTHYEEAFKQYDSESDMEKHTSVNKKTLMKVMTQSIIALFGNPSQTQIE